MFYTPLYQIASKIKKAWKPLSLAAAPYVDAMSNLNKADEFYMSHSGKSIILNFLSNASMWTGPEAQEVKAELNAILKGKQFIPSQKVLEAKKVKKVLKKLAEDI